MKALGTEQPFVVENKDLIRMNDQNDQIRTYVYMQSTTMSLEKEIHTKSTTENTVTYAVLLCMDQAVISGRCRHTPFAVARQYHII